MKNLSIFRASCCARFLHTSAAAKFLRIKSKCFAFSLVEMLMALLVASLLMAALAPVMTRKMNENINVSGTGSAVTNKYCAFINDETEGLSFEGDEGCIVPDGIYSASAIIASGGGGGGGAAGISESTNKEISLADTLTDETTTITFDGTTSNLEISISGAGGGGGGGSYYTNNLSAPTKQEDCTNYGLGKTDTSGHTGTMSSPIFIYDPDNSLCITAYNQKTSSGCTDYKGGTVIVPLCSYSGASTACNSLADILNDGTTWKLPTAIQAGKWTCAFSRAKISANGLQACTISEGYGEYCPYQTDTTTFIYNKNPYDIWTSTYVNYDRCENNDARENYGNWDKNCGINEQPICSEKWSDGRTEYASARCVTNSVLVFKSFSGSGGTSGSYGKIKISNDIVRKALEFGGGKGTIVLTPGKGGAGGSKTTAANGDAGGGNPGEASKVSIYSGSSGGTLVWMFEIPGGYGGNGASGDADGLPKYTDLPKPMCKFYDISSAKYGTEEYKNGKEVECAVIPGINFTAGANTVGATGASGSFSGNGGDGFGCDDKNNDTPITCYAGADGQNGRVKITHTVTYPGVGGGGGAAGNVVHITNFSVNKGDIIKAVVGNGGKGGAGTDNASGTDGADGGASYIELPNGKQYGTFGGRGGKGGRKGSPTPTTDPDTGLNVSYLIPKAGLGGKAQGLFSGTKVPKNYYFQGKDGFNAPALPNLPKDFASHTTAFGGHGGINPKISHLNPEDDGNGYPCGGYNTRDEIEVNDEIIWKAENICKADSNIPLPLSRTIYANAFNSDTIKNFSLGATGGGGGGWDKYAEAGKQAASGAKGMGGYIYIYFGDWKPKE